MLALFPAESFCLLAEKEENGQREEARTPRDLRAKHVWCPWDTLTAEPPANCSWDPGSSQVHPKSLRYNTSQKSQDKDLMQVSCWRFGMPITLFPQPLKSVVCKYRRNEDQSMSSKNGYRCPIAPVGQESQLAVTWKTKVGPQDQVVSRYFPTALDLGT